MIHYHGLPITPGTAAVEAVHAGHAFVSFAHPGQLGIAMEVCQSFALDNGAFSAWKQGNPVNDWNPFYSWVKEVMGHPGFDWACMPDVIDGNEEDNDALLAEWPLPRTIGVPVWHMHESIDRLYRLCTEYPRVAMGSSGEYSKVGSPLWWAKMTQAMDAICDSGGHPRAKLHGLRMLNPKIFSRLPLSSADSTNIGRNVGIDKHWQNGNYLPMSKEARAMTMRRRIEHHNSAQYWVSEGQSELFKEQA